MEECFFEKLLADNETTCVIEALLPPWKNLTTEKPSCTLTREDRFLRRLGNGSAKYSDGCECKRRCKVNKYAIAFHATPACEGMDDPMLFFTVVSKQVRCRSVEVIQILNPMKCIPAYIQMYACPCWNLFS